MRTLSMLLLAGLLWAAPAPAQLQAVDQDTWVTRIRETRQAVEKAREEVLKSRITYSRMKRSRDARGEEKREILEARDSSERQLATAEQALDEMLEEARRAGVPPGWVREAMAGFVENPAALAE